MAWTFALHFLIDLPGVQGLRPGDDVVCTPLQSKNSKQTVRNVVIWIMLHGEKR